MNLLIHTCRQSSFVRRIIAYGTVWLLHCKKPGDVSGVQQTVKKIRDMGGHVETDASRWLAYVSRLINPVLRRAE